MEVIEMMEKKKDKIKSMPKKALDTIWEHKMEIVTVGLVLAGMHIHQRGVIKGVNGGYKLGVKDCANRMNQECVANNIGVLDENGKIDVVQFDPIIIDHTKH